MLCPAIQEAAKLATTGVYPAVADATGQGGGAASRRAADFAKLGAASAAAVRHEPPTPVDPKSLTRAFR